jgi:uncharacterized protein YjbI with pentapeptide repeats
LVGCSGWFPFFWVVGVVDINYPYDRSNETPNRVDPDAKNSDTNSIDGDGNRGLQGNENFGVLGDGNNIECHDLNASGSHFVKMENGNYYNINITHNHNYYPASDGKSESKSGQSSIPLDCEINSKKLLVKLSSTMDKVDEQKLTYLEAQLREIGLDVNLIILKAEEGSVKITIDAKPETLERLKTLFESGELTELLEFPIEDVQILNEDISNDNDSLVLVETPSSQEIVKEIIEGRRRNLREADLSEAYLYGANLSEANLRKANLSKAYLYGANLIGANLRGANLRKAYLSEADLSNANLRGANLSEADLREANLSRAYLHGANLSKAYLYGAYFYGANLSKASLSSAYLSEGKLSNTNLSSANLSSANLSAANLSRANLSAANLSGADLNSAYLSGANLCGANLSGANLNNASLNNANLNNASLSGANLSGANLSGANLSGAYLSRANLSGANLNNASLIGASLIGASLIGASLIGASLSGANLIATNLSAANLSGVNLSGVNLSGAIVEDAVFVNTSGLQETERDDLERRGAIFGDRPPVLVPR